MDEKERVESEMDVNPEEQMMGDWKRRDECKTIKTWQK
jgi:hypothetical protein